MGCCIWSKLLGIVEKLMCDEVKIARLEVRQDEHMRNFERHCAEESDSFDALFNQVRKLEASLNSIDRALSNQKTFIGAMVLFLSSIFAVVGLAVQYFGKSS
jgi:hypothetical protein